MYTILLTENAELKQLLETNFREDCRILMAEDLEGFLHRVRTENVDIALVDLDLPGCRRPETVAQLQRFSQTGAVLFMTDLEFFDSSHPMTAVAAVDYLLRPFRDLDLLLTVENTLHQLEKKRQMEEDSLRLRLVRE